MDPGELTRLIERLRAAGIFGHRHGNHLGRFPCGPAGGAFGLRPRRPGVLHPLRPPLPRGAPAARSAIRARSSSNLCSKTAVCARSDRTSSTTASCSRARHRARRSRVRHHAGLLPAGSLKRSHSLDQIALDVLDHKPIAFEDLVGKRKGIAPLPRSRWRTPCPMRARTPTSP